MRRFAFGAAALLFAAPLPVCAAPAASAQATPGTAIPPAKPPAAAAPIPAATAPPVAPPDPPAPTPEVEPPPATQPCGDRAARFESGKGFKMVITRAGQVRTTNPLRPLTPEVNEVLQVVIAGKVATAYGPDFATLRRGSRPAAIEAMLGSPIRWQPALTTLPDPVTIVSEEGTPLAQLAFRACEAPPAVKAPPKAEARKKAPVKRAAPKPAVEKTPSGFSMPQGAIAE